MIYFFKKYWKYIVSVFSVCMILLFTYIYYDNNNISVKSDTKLSKIEKVKEEKTNDSVFVDIKGAIVTPGVYQMDETSRIIDVINLAGGLLDNANTSNINLSKKVQDEMYIIVYTNDEINSYVNKNEKTSCISTECICPNKENDACITKEEEKNNSEMSDKVSINTATKEELMTLSGIGEVKAENIIKYRNDNGKFNSIEDIKNVSGISDSTFEKIKDNIIL